MSSQAFKGAGWGESPGECLVEDKNAALVSALSSGEGQGQGWWLGPAGPLGQVSPCVEMKPCSLALGPGKLVQPSSSDGVFLCGQEEKGEQGQ